MSKVSFDLPTHCPHCMSDQELSFDFDFENSDMSGCDSKEVIAECSECEIEFSRYARFNFDFDVM